MMTDFYGRPFPQLKKKNAFVNHEYDKYSKLCLMMKRQNDTLNQF